MKHIDTYFLGDDSPRRFKDEYIEMNYYEYSETAQIKIDQLIVDQLMIDRVCSWIFDRDDWREIETRIDRFTNSMRSQVGSLQNSIREAIISWNTTIPTTSGMIAPEGSSA